MKELCRAIILRAICDSLGFTNTTKSTVLHKALIKEARSWFYDDGEWFQIVCEIAEFDPGRVRRGVIHLIEAKQSGDHTNIPDFWRRAFVNGRMPSFAAYKKEIDNRLTRK